MTTSKMPGAAASLLAAAIVAGCGHAHHHSASASPAGVPGDERSVSRTIEVSMSDNMRFSPPLINVMQGETIRFVVRNDGRLKHEMVLGTIHELKEHAEAMKKHPGMEHDEPNQAVAEPGKSAQMIWRFTNAGEFDFGCLQPGHFEAGMIGRIRVVPR